MNSDFYLYLPTFSNTHSNRFSILCSISFKYYFFHSLFILFLTTTHLPIFFYTTHHYYNWKNVFEEWTVAHQTWWATVHEPKKKSMFAESVGASTMHLILQIIANRAGYPNRWRCSKYKNGKKGEQLSQPCLRQQ